MNKLFTKAIGVALGLTMAIGVGVAVAGQQKGFREAKADGTYEETTTIAVGDQIVFANSSANKELKAIEDVKGTYVGTVQAYTGSVPAGVFPLTVAAGTEENSFAFKTSGNVYLSWSSGNSLTTNSSIANASSWKLVSVSGKGLMLQNVSTTTRHLSYNNSASRFATYNNTGQAAINLFKYVDGSATKYTITYDSNGGSGEMDDTVATSPVIADCTFTAPAVGKKFASWNTAADGTGESYAPGSTVTKDLDLYAIWVDIPDYTCAQAIAAIDADGETTKVFVSGYVTSLISTSVSGGKISYWIADTADGGNQFEVYIGLGLNGADFTNLSDVQVGAFVKCYGDIVKYNSTYEFANGSYLVSYSAPALSSIAISGAKTEYEIGDEFVKPTVTATYVGGSEKDVSASATFTGYNLAVAGDYTVTASYTENGVTKTAEYDITVTAPVTKYTVTFLAGEGSGSMDPVQVNENALYTLPACTFTAPAGKQFRGWTLNGTDIVTEITVTGAVSVTALWEVIPTVDYKKVKTNLANFSGDYLIVYEGETKYAFDGSLETLDASSNTVEVTISDELINLAETSEFHVAAKEGGYSIKSASSLYIGKTADSNGLDSKATDTYTNTISYADDVMNIVGSGNAVMRYNKASGQERFRFFKTSTYSDQEEISLYMQVTDAEALALDILNETAETCDAWTQDTDASKYAERKAALATVWSNLKTKYSSVDMDDLKDVVAKKDGVMVEEAMARYELLTAKYELENFISSRTPHANSFSQSFEANNDTIMIIVVVIAAMSALSMVAFLTIKRRKHN